MTHEAAALYQSGRIQEAEECYKKALKVDKKEPVVWGMLGSVLRAQGKYDEAIEAYQKCFKFSKDPHQAFQLNYAVLLREMGKIDEAEEVLTKLVQTYPYQSMGWFNLGNVQFQKRNWKQAEESYSVALKHAPGPDIRVKVLYNMGDTLKQLGEIDRAEKAFMEASEIAPTNPDIQRALKGIRSLKGDAMGIESTVRSIQFVGKGDDGEEDRMGLPEGAVEVAKKTYVELQTRLELAYQLWHDRRYDEALEIAREMSQSLGTLPQIDQLYADIYNGQGKFLDSLRIAEEIIEKYPNNIEIYLTQGEALTGLGRIKEAEESMQKALDISKNHDKVIAYVENWRKKIG